MSKKIIKALSYKRKRQGKTDYNKRIKLIISEKPRLIIRKSTKHILAQIAEYNSTGDKIKITVHSNMLKKYGWDYNTGNISAAYLVGLLVGKKAIKKGVKEAVPDIGLNQSVKGSSLYAALKGAIDSGLKVPASQEVFPEDNRIKGLHIANYANLLKKENKAAHDKQFSMYLKKNLDPEKIAEKFEEVKNKIIEEK